MLEFPQYDLDWLQTLEITTDYFSSEYFKQQQKNY